MHFLWTVLRQRNKKPRNRSGAHQFLRLGRRGSALAERRQAYVVETFHDGDAERPDDETYKGSYFINANSATAPGVVDADCNPIIDRSEMYSGVKGRASINLYAYNVNGNRGIACGLNNLQKLSNGTALGGKSRAEDDFATEDDEDFLN